MVVLSIVIMIIVVSIVMDDTHNRLSFPHHLPELSPTTSIILTKSILIALLLDPILIIILIILYYFIYANTIVITITHDITIIVVVIDGVHDIQWHGHFPNHLLLYIHRYLFDLSSNLYLYHTSTITLRE